MSTVFSARNLLYWWVFLTSFIFLKTPATDLAKNLRNNQMFAQGAFPFSIAEGFTRWFDDRATQIIKAFQFDPNVVVVKTGNTLILDGYRVGFLLILVFLLLAVRYYMRALNSPNIYDDLLALVICFFVYHLIGQTLRIIKMGPIGPAGVGVTLGDQMINERSNWVWLLGLVILGMAIGGRGWADAKVFWRGVIELFGVWLFFIPQSAAGGFANLLDWMVGFGVAITDPKNTLWTLGWALAGLATAINRIYTAQGGGSPGGPPAKSLGGLIGSLGKGKPKGA
ncbi:MAG: hypothetical protein HZB53_14990 [Chloroflexi bacterium]|nr:hypothetical protein [Chloroflexota bacterium]